MYEKACTALKDDKARTLGKIASPTTVLVLVLVLVPDIFGLVQEKAARTVVVRAIEEKSVLALKSQENQPNIISYICQKPSHYTTSCPKREDNK